MDTAIESLLAVVLFSIIHLFVGKLHFLDKSPHSPWLSASGGVAVAYVFVRTLPKLDQMNNTLMAAKDSGLYGFLEHHAYLVALSGFIFFMGIEFAGVRLQPPCYQRSPGKKIYICFKWFQGAGLAGYSLLISYLTHSMARAGHLQLVLISTAMSIHFIGSDYHLRHQDARLYDRYYRWALVLASFAGWGIPFFIEASKTTIALWYAVLSGGVIINAIKDELPDIRHGYFWAFFSGAFAYTLLLLYIEYISRGNI